MYKYAGVWHIWRLATRESVDVQKQSTDFQKHSPYLSHIWYHLVHIADPDHPLSSKMVLWKKDTQLWILPLQKFHMIMFQNHIWSHVNTCDHTCDHMWFWSMFMWNVCKGSRIWRQYGVLMAYFGHAHWKKGDKFSRQSDFWLISILCPGGETTFSYVNTLTRIVILTLINNMTR